MGTIRRTALIATAAPARHCGRSPDRAAVKLGCGRSSDRAAVKLGCGRSSDRAAVKLGCGRSSDRAASADRRSPCRFLSVLAIIALTLTPFVAWPVAAAPSQDADSYDDERFLAALYARDLFTLAQSYCRRNLAKEDLPLARRRRLTTELIRAYSLHAAGSRGPERDRLWKAADQVAGDYLREHEADPQRLLVQFQHALATLARAELAQQEMELLGQEAERRRASLELARAATRQLESLESQAETMLRTARPAVQVAAGEFSRESLTVVRDQIQYHLARAYRNIGLHYAAGTGDRINAFTQAIEKLNPITRARGDEPLIWQAKIDEAMSYRLRGKLEEATQRLARVLREEPPPDLKLLARAEEIRLLLAREQVEQAVALAKQMQNRDEDRPPTLDLAILEAFTAAWRRANGSQDRQVEARRRAALAALAHLEETHGAYWAYRGDMIVGRLKSAGRGGADLEVLRRAATNLYRQKKPAEAAAAFQAAAEKAAQFENPAMARELWMAAAYIRNELQQRPAALAAYRRAALAAPTHQAAPRAHQYAIQLADVMLRRSFEEHAARQRDATLPTHELRHRPGYLGDQLLYEQLLAEHV